MDPQFNKEPALRLPQPMPDHAAWQAPLGGAHEQAPGFELGSQPSQGAPMLTPAMPLAQQPQSLQQAVPMASGTNSSQASAGTQAAADEFNDDRVWIERAKRIVEQTHTDPYLESQEIGKFKAEYLKDVHARNIKVAEG